MIASKPVLNKEQCGAQFLIEYWIPLPEKSLKILPGKPKLCGQPCKDVLGNWTQLDILSQSEKRVKTNEIAVNIGNWEVNGLEVV